MDGYETGSRIRGRSHTRTAKFIAMTGWGQEQHRRRTEAAGFNDHIVKPADIGALQALLSSLEERK